MVAAAGCTRSETDDTTIDTSSLIETNETGETGETGDSTVVDTDTGETGDPIDTSPPALPAPEGFAFCAAGGFVESLDYSGIMCLGPMDVGAGMSGGNGSPTWQAGPIYILAPE